MKGLPSVSLCKNITDSNQPPSATISDNTVACIHETSVISFAAELINPAIEWAVA